VDAFVACGVSGVQQYPQRLVTGSVPSLLTRETIDMNRGSSSNFVPDMRNFDHIAMVCLMRAPLIQKRECVEEITG
jgi:hypothetical protein